MSVGAGYACSIAHNGQVSQFPFRDFLGDQAISGWT